MHDGQQTRQVAERRLGTAVGGNAVVDRDRGDRISGPRECRGLLESRERTITARGAGAKFGECRRRVGVVAGAGELEGFAKAKPIRLAPGLPIFIPAHATRYRDRYHDRYGDGIGAVLFPELEVPFLANVLVDFPKDLSHGPLRRKPGLG